MLWFTEGKAFTDASALADHLMQYAPDSDYDEFLDENNEPAVVNGMRFAPSDILKDCDPIAYREGLFGWQDETRSEIVRRLWCMEAGDTAIFFHINSVCCVADASTCIEYEEETKC